MITDSFARLACVVVMCSLIQHSAYAGRDYNGIFKANIYDQTEVLQRLKMIHVPEDQYNLELENELLRKKKEALKETCYKRAHEKLRFLEIKYQIALNGENLRDLITELGAIAEKAPLVGSSIGSYVGAGFGSLVGLGIGTAIQLTAKLSAENATRKLVKSHPDYLVRISEIAKEMHDVALDIFNYENDLSAEPVLPLEICYIHRKRFIKNEDLRREIESQLIYARMQTITPTMTFEFVNRALKLPIGPRIIEETIDELENRFDVDPFFLGFELRLREDLKGIIRESARDSHLPDDTKIPMRRCYYFYGSSSTGKSEAARKIPQFLKLPYIETSITKSRMQGPDYMEGSYRGPMAVNLGMWVEPFLTMVDGQTFSNAYLIINDSDDILDPKDPSAKTFYTNYLDSCILEFFSKYFNCRFPIHRLVTIITSNKEQTRTEENAPLMSRLTPIFFPRLSDETIKLDMDAFLELLQQTYVTELPEVIKLSYVDPQYLQASYKRSKAQNIWNLRRVSLSDIPALQEVFQNASPYYVPIRRAANDDGKRIEIRDIKNKYLKTTLDHFAREVKKDGKEFFELAERSFRINDDTSGMKYLKQAALKGHLAAIMMLKGKQLAYEIRWRKEILKTKIIDGEKRKHLSLIIRFYQELENMDEAKDWLVKTEFLKESWANWNVVISLLPKEVKSEIDRRLLNTIFKYITYCSDVAEVGGQLSQMNVYSPKTSKFDAKSTEDCVVYALWLHNRESFPDLYDLAESIEKKEGIGNKFAIACYKRAADEDCYLPSTKEKRAMAQFKMGWFYWQLYSLTKPSGSLKFKLRLKEHYYKEASNWAERSANLGSAWGYYLLGRLLEANNIWYGDTGALARYKQAHDNGIFFASHRLLSYKKTISFSDATKMNNLREVVLKNVDTLSKAFKDYAQSLKETSEVIQGVFEILGTQQPYFGFFYDYLLFCGEVESSSLYYVPTGFPFALDIFYESYEKTWQTRAKTLQYEPLLKEVGQYMD